jgi:dipeptide transport system permease protein
MSLAVFAFRRLLWAVPLLLAIMLATFALMRGSGGSPFRPPEGYVGVPYTLELKLRDFYHLDEPWIVEYAIYVKNVFTFQFGPSLVNRNVSVDEVMRDRFPITLELVALAAGVALVGGVALGLLAATHRSTSLDFLATSTATVLLVIPVFFVAYVLAYYPAREWHLAPLGWETWDARVLPVLALALAPAGYIARLVRAAVVETLQEDYVTAARAKGLRPWRILLVHVLRNSLGPLLSAFMPMLALLITGALFVEELFAIPGAATTFVGAAVTRDYPLLMGLTVALAGIVLAASFVADVAHAALEPRLRERLLA